MSEKPLPELVGQIHAWLGTMRTESGFGGPVSHWWRDSLRYTGPGLDWRYEGIIHGYLNLYISTDNESWLTAASVAGRDIVNGQLKGGNYRASAFERNPESGGTPHEACASGALLRLAEVRRDHGFDVDQLVKTAQQNLEWHLDALWNSQDKSFSDTVGMRSYVPNKIASTIDALLRWTSFTDRRLDQYIRHAAESIVRLQVESGPRRGAIHQLCVKTAGTEADGDGRYFPLYIARCIPPLLAAGQWLDEQRYIDGAIQAGEFLCDVQNENGSFPQVVYQTGHRNDFPRWIAGIGDILRAYDVLNSYKAQFPTKKAEEWLLRGFDKCGAFQTAVGFGRVDGYGEQRAFADLLHVVGWNDKAFRWLTTHVDQVAQMDTNRIESQCEKDSVPGRFVEHGETIKFVPNGQQNPTYRWDKESNWAGVT